MHGNDQEWQRIAKANPNDTICLSMTKVYFGALKCVRPNGLVNVRDVMKTCGFTSPNAVNPALMKLAKMGLLKRIQPKTLNGRKPIPVYTLVPVTIFAEKCLLKKGKPHNRKGPGSL